MKIYRRLETPKLYANVYLQVISDEGVLSDGALNTAYSSMQIFIEDSTGTLLAIDGANTYAGMTEDTTGKYYYAGYTIPADANLGTWNWEARATSGTTVATGRSSFLVEEQVA